MVEALVLSRKEKALLFFLLSFFTFLVLLASFLLPNIVLMVIFNSVFLFALLFYLLLYLNKSGHGAQKLPKSFPSVSIIIPMYNSKNTIKACVESVKKIKWGGKLEIVVVDDCYCFKFVLIFIMMSILIISDVFRMVGHHNPI